MHVIWPFWALRRILSILLSTIIVFPKADGANIICPAFGKGEITAARTAIG
jgi:hypothetical protein